MRWIDRLMVVSDKSGRYESEQQRSESQAVFGEARNVYAEIAERAVEYWGDGS